ncbi:MAG: GntR family transcriptional regulator [Clostridiales bacterium]|nr:GntR family transcriptional regulator [Candidatus Blautia equi]
MIYLDYQDRRPIYEQVVEKFRNLIISNVLPPGSKMPSVRQLAIDLSINPNTIQRAYMELEQQGLIYPVKGRGNFVAETAQIKAQSLTAFAEEMSQLVNKGLGLGITEQEMLDMVSDTCRKKGTDFSTTENNNNGRNRT